MLLLGSSTHNFPAIVGDAVDQMNPLRHLLFAESNPAPSAPFMDANSVQVLTGCTSIIWPDQGKRSFPRTIAMLVVVRRVRHTAIGRVRMHLGQVYQPLGTHGAGKEERRCRIYTIIDGGLVQPRYGQRRHYLAGFRF